MRMVIADVSVAAKSTFGKIFNADIICHEDICPHVGRKITHAVNVSRAIYSTKEIFRCSEGH